MVEDRIFDGDRGPTKLIDHAGHPITCVFCFDIEAEDRLVVFQNDHAIVFWDANPVTPGHALIIPTRHAVFMADLRPVEISNMMALMTVTQQLVTNTIAPIPGGFTIGINDGPIAGQTVPHVHMHLIPRHEGDVPNPRGGIRRIFPDDTYVRSP